MKPVPPSELRDVVKELVPSASVWVGGDHDLSEALDWAAQARYGAKEHKLVVIAGSLYLVADFYRLINEQ